MNDTVTGTVASQRKDRKGFKLDNGEWYSVFNASDCPERDTVVEFAYIRKGNFNNVRGPIRVIGGAATPSGTPSTRGGGAPRASTSDKDRQQSIIRQNSLGHAVNVWQNCAAVDPQKQTPDTMISHAEDIVEVAKVFEAYSSGKADEAALNAAVKSVFSEELVDTSVQ